MSYFLVTTGWLRKVYPEDAAILGLPKLTPEERVEMPPENEGQVPVHISFLSVEFKC